jgi:ABC-2 type transport system permease protein
LAGVASAPRSNKATLPGRPRLINWSNIYWLCWLRVKLLLRGYTRDWRRIVGGILLLLIAIPFLGGIALGTFAGYVALPRQEAAELLLLVLVGLYILWSLLPLIEFSVNEGLDVTKLTLYPLTRVERMISLLLATLLDIPTLGIIALFAAIVLGWSHPITTILIAAPALLIAYVHIVGLSQLVLAAFMGLLRSRRYRDLSIILFALFGSACSIGQQLLARSFNKFDSSDLAFLHLAQYLRFTPPGMTGWAIVRASEGSWLSALAWLAAGLITTVPILWAWMALLERGLAMAESGTTHARRQHRQAGMLSHHDRSGDHSQSTVPAPMLSGAGSSAASLVERARNFLPPPVRAIFLKDLRYFWRDPQLKASMLSSFFILIVIFVGPALGMRPGASNGQPWTVLFSCLAPLFMAMNFSLNALGLERQALTTLFLFPVRAQYILWGKNLAVASVAFGEQVLIAAAFAFIANSWAYFVPAIIVGIAAIAVMLGCGNILSVLLPFRVAQFKMGTSASGTPESGCLRSIMGMVSLGVTLVVLSPVIAGIVLPLLYFKTPGMLTITLPLSLLYGFIIHLSATRFIAPRLEQRIPEILAQTTRE